MFGDLITEYHRNHYLFYSAEIGPTASPLRTESNSVSGVSNTVLPPGGNKAKQYAL